MSEHAQHHICHICKRSFSNTGLRRWASVRPGVGELIEAEAPSWVEGKHICRKDFAKFRAKYIEKLLEAERGPLSVLDRQVIANIANGQTQAQSPAELAADEAGFGARMADRVAAFGGSWTFILAFSTLILVWMTINAIGLLVRPFDPYLFISLNLVLSSLAALQAPIIMMAQRRQDSKDRLRADIDYQVNLKAELEILQLHEKLDHQLSRQWEKLVELQQVQIELLTDRNTK